MLFLIMLAILIALVVVFSFAGAESGFGGFVVGLWLMAIVGWVSNIVTIWGGPALAQYGVQEILRLVGIVLAPIGAVLGYI